MCGIAGVYSLLPTGTSSDMTNILRELAGANTIRGSDSTGMFFYKPDNKGQDLWYLKDTVPGHQFLGGREAWRSMLLDSRFVVMHNRSATIGEVTVEFAHPFVETNVTGVHNGTVRFWEHLCSKLPVEGKMDSHAIFTALDHSDPDPGAVEEILRSIESGAYALVWYDKRIRSLRFARNNDRPLHMVKTYAGVWFASELGMLEWILSRNRIVMHQSWAIRPHVLVDIPLDGGEARPHEYRVHYRSVSTWPTSSALVGSLIPDDDDDLDDVYSYTARPYHGGSTWWDNRYNPPGTRKSAWDEWESAKDKEAAEAREAKYKEQVQEAMKKTQKGLTCVTFNERGTLPISIPTVCYEPIYNAMCSVIGEPSSVNPSATWHAMDEPLRKTLNECLYAQCPEAVRDNLLDATLVPVHVVDADDVTLYGYVELAEADVAVSFSLLTTDLVREVKEVLASGKEALVYNVEIDGIRVYHHGDVALRAKKVHENSKAVWAGALDLDWNAEDSHCNLYGTSHPERVSRIANVDWKAGWVSKEKDND